MSQSLNCCSSCLLLVTLLTKVQINLTMKILTNKVRMPYTLNILQEIFHGQSNKIFYITPHTSFPVSEADIDRFLGFICKEFPHKSITPKLHMLEDHVCSFLRKWYIGLGFYGEQGIEGMHSVFRIQPSSRYFDHVKKKEVNRLSQIMVNPVSITQPPESNTGRKGFQT